MVKLHLPARCLWLESSSTQAFWCSVRDIPQKVSSRVWKIRSYLVIALVIIQFHITPAIHWLMKRLHYVGHYSLRLYSCVCPRRRTITREIHCVFRWILRERLWLVWRPSAHFTASLMKTGEKENILHSCLLSSILLCTLLLIVNLGCYDTKVRLTRLGLLSLAVHSPLPSP